MMDFETVGRKALEVFSAEIGVKQAKAELFKAFEAYKEANYSGKHIERDSAEWQAMRDATTAEHEKLVRAKMDLRNAKARLNLQIKRGLGDTTRLKK